MKLTSQERVNRAFNREEHDRVPRHESFWVDTINNWTKEGLEGGEEGAREQLGSDLMKINVFHWSSPYPGRRDVIAEDELTVTYTDEWGGKVRYFKNKQTTPEHVGWECDSVDVWRSKIKPAILNEGVNIDIDYSLDLFQKARDAGKWCYVCGGEAFEILRRLLGDVESLMAMVEEPDWISEIAEVTTDAALKNFEALYDAGAKADGMWMFGDMAFNHSTMCSPALYKELIWPSHKKMCDWAHEHGMKFIYHTDGDVNGVLDLYVEAGFDCLQPLECKANMDICKLVPDYGKDLLFFGNINVMKMIDNDLEKIEEEVKQKITAGKSAGGYIYHSDHSVPPQVSWKTYQRIIEMVEKYGNY
jgi:uroporphyrinogen decarboxylase